MNKKYTQQTLREAIYYMVPKYRIAVEMDPTEMNLPQMLKYAVGEAFLRDIFLRNNKEFQNHANILRQALKDVKEHGKFIFSEQS